MTIPNCQQVLKQLSLHLVKVSKDVMMTILGIKDSVLDICPNKRVVHLAKHGSKKTRKKNFHRAIRILEER